MTDITPYSALTRIDRSFGRYIQVVENRLHDIIRPLLKSIVVDEKWYIKRYADVGEAVRLGRISTATQHYVEAGYFENRFPREIIVDEGWYLDFYRDVADAVSGGEFVSAQEHFEKEGYREGRLPSSDWRL